jgi:hypothetical protein
MSKIIAVIIAILIVIVGFAVALKFNIIPKKEYGPYDDFIICLKSSGAKFYGDYTNRESLMQMGLFGDSLGALEKSGIYIECNQYGPSPKIEKCREANIMIYPTWIMKNKKYKGIQGLNKLSELTGCDYE